MTLPIPTEEIEQAQLVQYLEMRHCKFTAIPNSTYTKSIQQKMKNSRAGLRAGFPDLVIIANGKFFCIEMKRTVGGRVTPEQKEWNAALNAAGIPSFVCYGFEAAKKIVDTALLSS